ncbi:MAG TPA: phosphotransferase [Ktedonobacteraceae bacterium]|nr:phosphotransferase [Ktedonobacteraceae bacterium]
MNSNLSDEMLFAALKAWPLSEPFTIQRLPGGMTSEIWLIEAEHERFIAKYAYTTRQAFESGLYAAELVERRGITSGVPLHTKQETLSILVEGRHGQSQPLALLQYVPGERLDLSRPDAASLYGYLLGRTHSILLDESGDWCAASLYDFLLEETPYIAVQPGLAPLIRQAIEAAREYEKHNKVTHGIIWADAMEIRCGKETGRTGIIDWGAIGRGPLLFDVALNECWYFPEGTQAYRKFIQAYLSEAPISASELEGIKYYKTLLWARQAKFFAYCVAENVTLGGSNSISNMQNLTKSRQELEYSLANL